MQKKIMLLGSGELGKEFVITVKRLGQYVIAVDSYNDAPAQQVADEREVIPMLDGTELDRIVTKHQPKAANFTMNRKAIRDLAARDLGLPTANYRYAANLEQLRTAVDAVGIPCVVKPLMSSSGKGQSVIKTAADADHAWNYAQSGKRGDQTEVIVEAFVKFHSEITLLTVTQQNGPTLFCPPIGHRQERGDYQESWQPALISDDYLAVAQDMAAKVTAALAGAGLWGVEFFLTDEGVYFSELSPRPHDTGMVTLAGTQNLSEFELHARAVLGLPIVEITQERVGASAVILAHKEGRDPVFIGVEKVLSDPKADIRLFGKPTTRPYRRMGVVLAYDRLGTDVDTIRQRAIALAKKVTLLLYSIALFVLPALKPTRLAAQSNDHIFPAADVAKTAITFDSRGFIIDGKRTFLVSAGLEYARIPHELWYDRLLRLKRAGFNCIEIYLFWNYHEPAEGKFDFTGDHDLDAFLKLVKKLDMYAICRVGPYYCAEWDFGGYPLWLRFKDSLLVRSPNAVFEKYVDSFFDRLIPIVAKNQINHGGSVILVQLENEHDLGWGTYMPNEYFEHLRKKALSLGLQVPYFFSGLHHGSDPAGNKSSLDDPNRPNPWFTTEFWSVWYDRYGSSQADADTYGRRTWKIIAHGGNGYNYYMAYGGTNFGYTNNDEDAASYDYGAAVGQTGDLRPMYYQFKKNAFFARTFREILESSQDGGAAYNHITTDTSLRVNTRHSSSGDIIFVDNPGKGAIAADLTIDKDFINKVTLAPGEIFHVVHDFQLTNDIRLDWSAVRILGADKEGRTTTLVVYGEPGSTGLLKFSSSRAIQAIEGNNAIQLGQNSAVLRLAFRDSTPVAYSFEAAGQRVRVLAVSGELANRTWFVTVAGKNYVITGPAYIADAAAANGHLEMNTEHFWKDNEEGSSYLFGDGISKVSRPASAQQPAHEEVVGFIGTWKAKNASEAAAPDFNDQSWLKSKKAPQMGADGDLTADAWYRTGVTVDKSGMYMLRAKYGGDRATVFIDGKNVASGRLRYKEVKFDLPEGRHSIAVFTAHDGRDKLVGYIGGAISNVDAKGLMGNVYLQKTWNGGMLTDWQTLPAPDLTHFPVETVMPDMTNAKPYKIGDDAFDSRRGFAWFQASIPYDPGHLPFLIDFNGVDDNAIVYINGRRAAQQDGYDVEFDAPLGGLIRKDTTNVVTVLVQNTDGGGGISKPVELEYDSASRILLADWSMKGGPGNFTSPEGWKTLDASTAFDRPYFYKNSFIVKNLHTTSKSMYRVTFEGLGHGSIWINGHNIGRYPEKIPVNSLYIPECWLIAGENSIVVYDEDGKTPGKIRIEAEKEASRDVIAQSF